MKRGFLNNKKVRKEALYPTESSGGTGAVANPVPALSASRAVGSKTEGAARIIVHKLPYGKVENTGLPTSYTPSKLPIIESDDGTTDHPKNALLITTIPSRTVGKPPLADGHSEWVVNGPTKNKVLNAPGYPQPVPKHPGTKSYEIKSTPTMGMGVFATRDIPMGEIIFAERPLLVVPRALRPTGNIDRLRGYSITDYTKIMLFEREKVLEVAVERMEPERRARLMALTNSHSEDGSGPISGIVRTNAYGADNLWDGDDQPEDKDGSNPHYYSVVCDVGSRINHSCLPNVCQVFKLSAFAVIFMADRDIKGGEQLFYSYCGLEQSASDRKAELAPYGIAQCICASCINATPETDVLRKTFSARIKAYKEQGIIWDQLPIANGWNLPVKTLDEMLRFQKAVVKEGLDRNSNYWIEFIPALGAAYRWNGRHSEAAMLLQELVRRGKYMHEKAAIERSEWGLVPPGA